MRRRPMVRQHAKQVIAVLARRKSRDPHQFAVLEKSLFPIAMGDIRVGIGFEGYDLAFDLVG